MPEGRRTVVGVRLSDDDCERLDAMRGGTSRAEFAYAVLKGTLGGIVPCEPDPEIPPAKLARAVKAAAAAGHKPAVPQAAFSDPPVNPLAPSPAVTCAHRGLKPGAWCRSCESVVPETGRKG